MLFGGDVWGRVDGRCLGHIGEYSGITPDSLLRIEPGFALQTNVLLTVLSHQPEACFLSL